MKYHIVNYSDNEIENYQSSLDESDDKFNFHNDYDYDT